MALGRVEPFQVALTALREHLREGRFAPGARIAATEIGDTLRLSATPVREALSRLAGEGLLEDRRGQGFFVRMLTGADIADLYRLSLGHLSIALDSRRVSLRPQTSAERNPIDPGADPVRTLERLLLEWVAGAGSRALLGSYRILTIQMGPVRRVEPVLFPGLYDELTELQGFATGPVGPTGLVALRRFHARRISVAEKLACVLERAVAEPKV